jgi:hexosaminidase
VGASPAAVAVRIAAAPAAGGAAVTLARQAGPGDVRYTADGSEPTGASPRYDAPFTVPLPSEVRAALFLKGVRAGPVAAQRVDAGAARRRASQDLRLCNPGLALNLEGEADAAGPHAYLTNPQDACWIYPAADLTGVEALTVTFARLPFNFSLDAGHNTVTLHPPRQSAGELEVREDGCQTDPVAVAAVPPGAPGVRGEIRLALPPRTGLHDLCFSFTAAAIDPMLALDVVQLEPPPAARPPRP